MASLEIISTTQTVDDSEVFPVFPVDSQENGVDSSAFFRQVARILRSDELHSSDVLQRLLKFLAKKSASGEADDLKEYVIAVEALGKPSSYDPRHNSGVRLLVSRLRQKLKSYYQNEGLSDDLVIDLPKGRFKLTCEVRDRSVEAVIRSTSTAAGSPVPEATQPIDIEAAPKVPAEIAKSPRVNYLAITIAAAVGITLGAVVALACNAYFSRTAATRAQGLMTPSSAGWDASVQELWGPFVASGIPIVVAIEDPLFVRIQNTFYRDSALDSWSDVVSSPKVKAVRDLSGDSDIQPIRFYTKFGEAIASFSIAKLLGSHVQDLTMVPTTDLSMHQAVDAETVLVGGLDSFTWQTQARSFDLPLIPVHRGIRNLHPNANEPQLFTDNYSEAPMAQGTAYALVTHIPGASGDNDLESFISGRIAGDLAAVTTFTDPRLTQPLVAKLKQAAGGKMPRYYQVLLRVDFKDQIPTAITIVLCRELQYANK